MSKIDWTKSQDKVIKTRDRNILVSAGAGSGKTAVLVERIIRLITDKDNPVDIDKFLIVTFTRAAAAQMKEKIRNELYKMSYEDKDDDNIKRQLSLIHTANICTIDSFANKIVSEYFEELDIDPNFRVIEEEEESMLVEDSISEVLNELYEAEDEEFLTVMEQLAAGSKEAKVIDKVKLIIDKAYNQVFPIKWLEDGKGKNYFGSEEEFEKSDFVKSARDFFGDYKEFEEELEYGWEKTQELGQEDNKESFGNDYNTLEKLRNATCYDDLRNAVINHKKMNIGSNKSYDGRDEAKHAHNELGKYCTRKKNMLSYFPSLKEAMEDVNNSQRIADVLIDIAIKAIGRCEKEKKYINAYSFNDVSHFAINILCEVDDKGNLKPSRVAEEMSEQFYEILIDEYQDSNYIQEYMLSVLTGGRGVGNMFMVGDVKQSIYRFRSAEPKLFLKKFNSFKEDDDRDDKILLGDNFRSRPEVIHATNFVFKEIMKKEIGGIDYEGDGKLVCGAKNYKLNLNDGENDNKTELICVASNDENRHVAEANLIAKKILKLMDEKTGLKITDENRKERTLNYKDIVILTRAPATVVDIYISELEKYGIPVFGEKKKGFYSTNEINTILDFMRVVDNPIQDIPLASVLRSELFDFSDEELAKIKIGNKYAKMYTALEKYAKSGSDDELKEKVENFLASLKDYRDKAKYMSVYEFIEYMLDSTHFEHFIRALPAGDRKQLNIDMLKEIAYDYENTSYRGLFNFIRFINQSIENDKDTGEAIEVSEDDDVVRIVSIHKSKGLEYPVVILANANSSKNVEKTDYFVDSDCNVGIEAYDINDKTITDTFIKRKLKEDEIIENKAEQFRLLYVAMTRAKEKLIIVSSFKGALDDKTLGTFGPRDPEKYKDNMLEAKTYHDFIAPVIGEELFVSLPEEYKPEDTPEGFNTKHFKVWFIPNLEHYGIIATTKDEETEENTEVDKDYAKIIQDNFDYEYSYEKELKLRAKMSVTEIKRRLNGEFVDEDALYFIPDRTVTGKPNFVEEDEENSVSGAELGNVYHKVLELIDFDLDLTDEAVVERFLQGLVEKNRIKENEKDAIDAARITKFADNELFARMKAANDRGELFREQKFLMEIDGETTGKIQHIETKETTIVQGIIDVCFIEDDEYVIVDYKTDKEEDKKKLVKDYEVQLDTYQKAIEQISKKAVKEKYIYSIKLGEEIPV